LVYQSLKLEGGAFNGASARRFKAGTKKQKYERISEKKMSTPIEVLCKNYPSEFASYFHYCRSLRFDDKPDYAYLKRIFRDLFIREGFQFDYVFDWTILKYQQSQISGVPSRTLGAAGGQSSGAAGDRASAGQNLRETQRAAEADASRRRLVGGAIGSGASNALESSKHRSPGHEESAKDSALAEPERMHSSSYGTRGGSSSRRAVVSSSRPSGPSEGVESRTMSSSKTGATSLRTPAGMHRSSPVGSSDPKRTFPSRHPQSNSRVYEAALKGVESLSVEVDGSQMK